MQIDKTHIKVTMWLRPNSPEKKTNKSLSNLMFKYDYTKQQENEILAH